MTDPASPMPSSSVPDRPIGALVLFLLFFVSAIAVLVDPIQASGDCAGPLFASSADRLNENCAPKYESRMTWFLLLAIPTVVAGCAMVSRWPRYFRAPDGSYLE